MPSLVKYRLPFFFLVAIFITTATFFAIKFTQGYRIDLTEKTLKPTGLLVATSIPDGAKVTVDDKLLTATDNTVSLSPGEYEVEIQKTGFSPWKKRLTIKKELVTETNAFLFPQVPDLKPLTFLETQNPQLSPDGGRLVYAIPLPHKEAGLWVMDINDFFLGISREPKQIAKSNPKGFDYSQSQYHWTFDGKQILLGFEGSPEQYLLEAAQLNPASSLVDISGSLDQIAKRWQEEEAIKEEARYKKVPLELREILASSAANIAFSPDNSKILYQATVSAEIPPDLIPPVVAASTQKETRQLTPGQFYVYDIKEDRNFALPLSLPLPPSPTPTPKVKTNKTIPTPTPTVSLSLASANHQSIRWFPTSRHLYWIDSAPDSGQGAKVVACEYDGTNLTTIYSGPFIAPFVYAAPGANRLIILTQLNLNDEAKPNLYTISLR